MKICPGHKESTNNRINRIRAVVCKKDNAIILSLLLFLLSSIPATSSARVIADIQHKACERSPVDGWIMPCTFDKPVQAGDLIVVAGVEGCNPLLPITVPKCDSVSDSQGNDWKIATGISSDNGILLWYALYAKGGDDTVYFAHHTGSLGIIAEYPPSTGLDDANFGTYTHQNLQDDPQGGSSDTGYTLPVVTTEPHELLIAWGVSGSQDLSALHGRFFPSPGPYFTVRESEYGAFGLEDSTTGIPGVYIASMKWNGYGHWALAVAAFRMGTIEVDNPSFEEISAPLAPSTTGPYNNGPIPEWSQSGNTGLWQPSPAGGMQVPDGKTVAWVDTGSISQYLGETSAKPYKLSVSVGNRYAGIGTWTISLNSGTTVLCTTSGSLLAIPPGTFATETLPCNVPAGDLTIVLGIQGRGALDNVRLTTTAPSTATTPQRELNKLWESRSPE